MDRITTGDRFRPTASDFLADPYPTYALLRRETSIAFYEGWGAWIVTRHPDVDRLLRDRRLGRVIEGAKATPHHPAFAAIQAGSLLEIMFEPERTPAMEWPGTRPSST